MIESCANTSGLDSLSVVCEIALQRLQSERRNVSDRKITSGQRHQGLKDAVYDVVSASQTPLRTIDIFDEIVKRKYAA